MSIATENPQGNIDTQIRISSGAMVDLANFKPDDVCRSSINRSLNNLKRFTGHWKFREPLTVAQHTLLCTLIAKEFDLHIIGKYSNQHGDWEEKLYQPVRVGCVIHDWPEAYYTDLSSPMKRFLGDSYREKIKEIDKVVYQVAWTGIFGLNDSFDIVKEQVKHCDHISLRIEQNMMFGTTPPEDYVQEFMQKYDAKGMFDHVASMTNVEL